MSQLTYICPKCRATTDVKAEHTRQDLGRNSPYFREHRVTWPRYCGLCGRKVPE